MNSLQQFENNDFEQKPKDNSNVIIKIILPVVSTLIVLIGLIVLYQAGNVDQYITNEMRIGFGYVLSFGLLAGYLFEKIRSTVFAQIILSATLSALTLTTIIATHGYKIFPHFIGLGILGILFFVGLFLAREHTSEIEFSTSALIGLSVPFFYSLDSFLMILVLEVIVIGALYLFLAFFKRVHFLHWIVLAVHILLSIIILFQYVTTFKVVQGGYNWVFNLYELLQLMLLWVPFFYFRRKFVNNETFQLLLIQITIFCAVIAIPFIHYQVSEPSEVRLHFGIVYAAIALFLFIQALILKEEEQSLLLHRLSYAVFGIGFIIFFEKFNFKIAALLTLTFLHMWLLNSTFLTDGKKRWNIFLNYVFGILGFCLSISIIINIFAFILRLPIVETTAFHERFIPPTILILNYWLAYFFVVPNRTFSFQKGLIFSFSWFFTALYFLYIPWQLMQTTLKGSPTIQLIILSALWIVAAYVATLIGLKKGRIGLRIFTIVIFTFLLLKIIVVDVSVFLELGQMFGFAVYAIVFGISLLILSRLLIKEFTKNGSLRDEWQQLKAAFMIQPKKPKSAIGLGQDFNNSQAIYPGETRLQEFAPSNQQPMTFEQAPPMQEFPSSIPEPQVMPLGVPTPPTIEATTNNFVPNAAEEVVWNEVPVAEIPSSTPKIEPQVVENVVNVQEEIQPVVDLSVSNQIETQTKLASLISLFEEQGKFNENQIMQLEMQLETQQLYIEAQKKMNEKIVEIVESLSKLENDREA